MKIQAIILSRFRAFKERQAIEIAPVTIIIGKNGSGKSVLSRLPLLIARSLNPISVGPIDLTAGGVDHGVSFLDLIHVRSALPFSLGLRIGDASQNFTFETFMRYVPEYRSLVVEEFRLYKDDDLHFHAEIINSEQLILINPLYLVNNHGASGEVSPLRFRGLLPEVDGPVGDILVRFAEALTSPSYLGPFRAEAEHFMRTPNQGIDDLGPRGQRALEMLADDRLRWGGGLAEEVQEWFAKTMGQSIDVDVASEQPRVKVTDASGFSVSLTDTGAGFPQSLPIVVQHLAYRMGRVESPLLIVEQPELHLHPAAHGALADLVVDTASDGSNWIPAQCIVETHSEQFVMRVRRRVAEGKIPPGHVKIWSLNHVSAGGEADAPEPLRVISLDRDGNPDDWPIGVFGESLDDLTAMRQSIRARSS